MYVSVVLVGAAAILFLVAAAAAWRAMQRRQVYLVDFACYRPADEHKCSHERFMYHSRLTGAFSEASLAFQQKILERSGIGHESYAPRSLTSIPMNKSMEEARYESETVMFGALDELFASTGIHPKMVDVLVVNCSLFNPTPSLASMIVNKYKMRVDIVSYNLAGMGCSAGIISIDLAKDLLLSRSNAYAIVVSTENITLNWYLGNDRNMLVTNCLFRMGGAAILLSNRYSERARAKYELVHTVRTHKGADDTSFKCVYQQEEQTSSGDQENRKESSDNESKGAAPAAVDAGEAAVAVESKSTLEVQPKEDTNLGSDEGTKLSSEEGTNLSSENGSTARPAVVGVSLSQDLMKVAEDALRTNIIHLGPLVLPLSEQIRYGVSILRQWWARFRKQKANKRYVPNFKRAFEHFCVHAGGRKVLDGIEKNLELTPWHMEPSRKTLFKWGNTSSSSLWYELAYCEATGRIRKGDRVWQIAFGSGFKCNSAVWRARRTIDARYVKNAWSQFLESQLS